MELQFYCKNYLLFNIYTFDKQFIYVTVRQSYDEHTEQNSR
jgi:hypothetical protein